MIKRRDRVVQGPLFQREISFSEPKSNSRSEFESHIWFRLDQRSGRRRGKYGIVLVHDIDVENSVDREVWTIISIFSLACDMDED